MKLHCIDISGSMGNSIGKDPVFDDFKADLQKAIDKAKETP